MAKLRCGNFEITNMQWLDNKDKHCKICDEEWCTLEHILGECQGIRESLSGVCENIKSLTYKEQTVETGNKEIIQVLEKYSKECRKKQVEKEREVNRLG